ncbi:MAG: leucyl aminopeptidase [Gammaproteobacteria bacterium]|nr:leucyl aminopeptidase [Gammaproteobacteria bacterium]MCP5200732.1 leucyl aminopeptidase [Gammaproteobacteria bacterium]
MEFSVKRGLPQKQKSACLIVAVHGGKHLSAAATALDKPLRGALSRVVQRGDVGAKPGDTLLLPDVHGIEAERVLLVACGRRDGISAGDYAKAVRSAAAALKTHKLRSAVSALLEVEVKGHDLAWKVDQHARAAAAAAYRFDEHKSKPGGAVPSRLGLLASDDDAPAVREALRRARALADGLKLARDLGNRPGNVCTPTHLAETAVELAGRHDKLECTVLEEAEMETLGMGALLSVARGSRQPAKLIVLEYRGGSEGDKPVVLVGKGVTFDSGGISIKPGAGMDEMKFDMCGAASVLGTLSAVADLGLPLNVVGLVPATENLPDGNASKPGDIVTSMSGQTIEILNTDAEGRLILCDALTYSARYEPAVVIDIATLTGACVIALGEHASGLLSNDDQLAADLLAAGERSGDRAWRLPLWEDYQKQLDSPFADMANVGGRAAGTITAACFLARFTRNYHWAHLDIAGTAWLSGKSKGASGRPVALLFEYLATRAG